MLTRSPQEVILKFSERVDSRTAAINLETPGNKRVQADRPQRWKNDPTALTVAVKHRLSGSYVLFWRVVGQDSHTVNGAFSFAVQTAGSESASPLPASAIVATTSKPFVQGALSVARAAVYLAMSALVGGVALLFFVWPDGVGLRRSRRVLWWAWGGLAAATALSAAIAQIAATGRALSALGQPHLLFGAAETHFGLVAVARLALLALAALLLVDLEEAVRTRSFWWCLPALAVAAGLIRTPGMVDHGATASVPVSLAYFLHMAGVTVWIGGLVLIVAVLVPNRAALDDPRAVLVRFSAAATVALAVVAASGLLLASPIIQHWRAVPSSDYGQLFVTKLVLLAAGLTLAWRLRRWLRRSPSGFGSTHVATLVTEAAFVVAVVVVTAVLVGRNPSLESSTRQPTSITQKGPTGVISPT